MRRTHKKILGFVGLGAVAAVTTVAATIPPMVSAKSAVVSDQISVYVTSAVKPTLTLSPSTGGKVTVPEYALKVTYDKLYQMTGTLVYTTGGGGEGRATIWEENVGGEFGQKDFNLNFNAYGGYGNFLITIKGLDKHGVPVERSLSIIYEDSTPKPPEPPEPPKPSDPEEEVKPGDEGEAEVPITVPTDTVEKVIVNVYDENGKLVKAIEVNNPDEANNIDFSDLNNGNYTMEVISYDDKGNKINESSETLVVDKSDDEGGKNAIVPIVEQEEETKKVVITVTNENGEVVKTIEVENLNDLPEGKYDIKTDYYDENDQKIGEDETIINTGEVNTEVTVEDQEEETKKVVVTIKDEKGEVVKTIEVTNPTPGQKIEVPTSELPGGNYEIVVDYYDEDGNKIDSTTTDVTKSNDNGDTNVEVETNIDNVTTIEAYVYDKDGNIVRIVRADRETGTVYVYDKDGNLLFTIPNGFRSDRDLTIPMDGLDSGDYATVITYKDANGKIIGDSKNVKISYEDGKAVVVPDTGSFFQGFNITREDYLITGVVVFTLVGAVAFGITMKKKKSVRSRR